jgi:polyisoprenoid-binding protein YceI
MALTAGTYTLGPDAGRLLVKTGRTGLGRRAGHDLTIEVTRWSGEAVVVDTQAPESSAVSVSVEVDSFEVREGRGGVKPLTDADRAEIGKVLRTRILHTAEHPSITFRSTAVEGTPESFTVHGDLTIMGETRPVTVHGVVTGPRVTGGATVVQSRWGIKPYSALLGALRLADPVEVEFDLTLPTGAEAAG